MTTLSELLEPRAAGPNRFTLEVPDGWQQGRGAYGGLVLGALARAALRSEPEATRRLRSLTGELAGPVGVGACDIEVKVLRRGNALSVVRAMLSQNGEELAQAVCVLGKQREGTPAWQLIAPPSPVPWTDLRPIPFEASISPSFARHFEYRTTGPLLYCGGDEPVASGWVHSLASGARDDAWLVAMADVWWPAAAATFAGPRPMATVAFTLQIVGDLDPSPSEAPLFHRAHSAVSRDGYAAEQRELWSADGRLLTLNHQTFAIIK